MLRFKNVTFLEFNKTKENRILGKASSVAQPRYLKIVYTGLPLEIKCVFSTSPV